MKEHLSLTFEMLQNLVFKFENVFAFIFFLHFEGHVSPHLIVKCLIDIA